MLHSAWKEMATEHADIIKSIEEVLRDSGPAAAVAKFQWVYDLFQYFILEVKIYFILNFLSFSKKVFILSHT